MSAALLYRIGTQLPVPYEDWLQSIVDFIDTQRPDGHVPRTGCLYASGDLNSFQRWKNVGTGAHRLWALDERLRVYPTIPYEKASGHFQDFQKQWGCPKATLALAVQSAKEYWNAGVPLADFLAGERGDCPDHWWSDNYEVLVDPQTVTRRQNIAPKTLAKLVAS